MIIRFTKLYTVGAHIFGRLSVLKIAVLKIEKHAQFSSEFASYDRYMYDSLSQNAGYYYIEKTQPWIRSDTEMHVIFCACLARKLIK